MTMTRKLNIDNGLQDWKTEHQAVTGGIFYCRDCGYFSVSASNKLSCALTVKCFEIGNKTYRQTLAAIMIAFKNVIYLMRKLIITR